jgi:hypothetical protein
MTEGKGEKEGGLFNCHRFQSFFIQKLYFPSCRRRRRSCGSATKRRHCCRPRAENISLGRVSLEANTCHRD